MNEQITPQPGRPLTFSPDEALFQILNVFWQRGFEHTSVSDLEAATGLTRPSLYNTFGNKRAMYEESITLYVSTLGQIIDATLLDGSAGLDDFISFVDVLVDGYHDQTHAAGCAIINAMAAHGELDPFGAAAGRTYRSRLLAGLQAAAQRAVELGEIRSDDVEGIVDRMHMYLIGLNILTRHDDTFTRIAENADAIKSAVRSWSLAP